MTKSSCHLTILLALTGLLFTQCQSTKPPVLESIEIVELSRIAGDGLLKVDLVFSNPNGKALTIKKIELDGSINQKAIGKFKLNKRGRIEKRSQQTVTAVFAFQPDNVYTGFLSNQFGAIGSKRVRISLLGDAVFLQEDSELILPVDYSEIYKIED